jgi:hypothetical protein
MAPTIKQTPNCTHIRFKQEDLEHLGSLRNLSLIFRLPDGKMLTLSADVPEVGPEDELDFYFPGTPACLAELTPGQSHD